MKRFLIVAVLALAAAPALAATVSINIGQPGYYGRIDLDGFPQPQVVYREPLIVQPVPVGVIREPIYVRVPAAHATNWRIYCRRYNACGQPVYFVQDSWYKDVYVPQYRDKHAEKQAKKQEKLEKKLAKQQEKEEKKLSKKDK